ncbi:2,3-bisphosphoglycerate-independent phosphoglycerate mutase, partial [Candidatus Woesearchaeota archaeon]|nr:2,3-bisphosphoglycerate-independent phosphoglycerate mutase [Candidatus Woesearchaeota archaeon]
VKKKVKRKEKKNKKENTRKPVGKKIKDKKKAVRKLKKGRNPVVLITIDGWGIRNKKEGNAVLQAETPNIDRLIEEYPHTKLKTSGTSLGLPKGIAANEKSSYISMGAGRKTEHEITEINKAIEDSSFFTKDIFLETVKNVKNSGKKLHIIGLLSDGGINSHIKHFLAMLDLAHYHFLDKVYIHIITDGIDDPHKKAKRYLRNLQNKIEKINTGKIASIIGRHYVLDKNKNWKYQKKAYDLWVKKKGRLLRDPMEAINMAYRNNKTDDLIEPVILDQRSEIDEGDSIVFLNFYSEGMENIVRAFKDKKFKKFPVKRFGELNVVCLTEYNKNLDVKVVFPQKEIKNNLAEYLSKKGISFIKIGETEGYDNITRFFNGGRDICYKTEKRAIIKSSKTEDPAKKPGMKAEKIAEEAVKAIKKRRCEFILVNFTNPSTIAMTGNIKAAKKAIEKVDESLGKITELIKKKNIYGIVAGTYGNAEFMEDKYGLPNKTYTTNYVPFILLRKRYSMNKKSAKIIDIAPTILHLLKIKPPEEMDGKDLIK